MMMIFTLKEKKQVSLKDDLYIPPEKLQFSIVLFASEVYHPYGVGSG